MMESFTMHRSYVNAMQCLPANKQLHFLMMIIVYALDGVEPEQDQLLTPMFQLIKPNIDESNRKRKTLSEIKKTGNRHSTTQDTAQDTTHDTAQTTTHRIGIGIGKGIGKGIGVEEEGKEGVSLQKPPTTLSLKRFSKPSVEEVAAYCAERNNGINAQKFVDHYETVGWVVGKSRTPMKDWRSAVRTWESMDRERQEESGGQRSEGGVIPWDPSKRKLRELRPADVD